jgi:hypothetical protein
MNVIAYRERHNELVAPPEPAARGGAMKIEVDQSSPWVQGHVVPPDPTPWL